MPPSAPFLGPAAALLLAARLAAATLPLPASPAPPPAGERPNILFLIADDLGIDKVGAYGLAPDAGPTPVIDALAQAGVLFRGAMSNPNCSPSRATMLTGRYGFRTGIGNSIPYVEGSLPLATEELTLAEVLSAEGYRCAAIGKWHLSSPSAGGLEHPVQQGFELHSGNIASFTNNDPPSIYFEWPKNIADASGAREVTSTTYATSDHVDDALAFMDAAGADPWFVWLAFNAPHSPYHAPPPELHTQDLPQPLDDHPVEHFRAMVEAMDTEIGRLLASMRPATLANTWIVFLGDNGTVNTVLTYNGWQPNQMKGSLYQGGVGVPLVIWGPGVTPGESDALVNLTDLYATVLDLTGSRHPAPRDSVSAVAALRDPGAPSARSWAYSERFKPNGAAVFDLHERAARGPRYKLVRDELSGQDELYDLLSPGAETADLLSPFGPPLSPAAAAAYAELDVVLDRLAWESARGR